MLTAGPGAARGSAGVGEQGDAGDGGQQLDQAGLADLGQVVDSSHCCRVVHLVDRLVSAV
jgi:hypothetical protein